MIDFGQLYIVILASGASTQLSKLEPHHIVDVDVVPEMLVADVFVGPVGGAADPGQEPSHMGILILAASKGTEVGIRAEGPDAGVAVASLGELIDNGFGEE